ncbi:MAG: Coenzyme F420 hydrogenase/dehydrogenase, beta subunit C-terminal domain [Bacteroidales bacterium]|nr:Coenzyme F420 hydrogenase/dehydrogenase, beta subunit C-terminal domain [Bacteroidales bacterium]
MRLCPPDKCSACGACEAICPVQCISMQPDAYGVTRPVIGKDCLECGQCSDTCPVLNPPSMHMPSKCFAAWNEDSSQRRRSSSGGVAALLAKAYDHSFGTAWDKDFNAIVKEGDAEEFKGSKYVHSSFSPEAYSSIRSLLKEGREVVFTGRPCQVAGLRNFLGKDFEGLVTADLLCHGTCPQNYLDDELEHIGKKNVTDVRFRSNDSDDFFLTLWNGSECIYRESASTQPYFKAYLEGLSLRENCYTCPYARPQRTGDLTLGDFIGLPGQKSFVGVNTPKGEKALERIREAFPSLRLEEHPYSDRQAYRPSLLQTTDKSPLRGKFLPLYPRYGFAKSARKVLRHSILKEKYMKTFPRFHKMAHTLKSKILRMFLLLVPALISLGCTSRQLKSGDLVFVGIPVDYSLDSTSMSSGIAAATGKEGPLNYIHTAIAEVEGGQVWIIDATLAHGVDRHPLDTFLTDFTLRDGSYPVFEVMRLKKGPRDLVENAKKHIGEPYDNNFLPDNGASYCTELVRDSYLDKDGKPILPANPMNFKGPDGEFPVYWVQLFGILGSPIPQDIPGTNPQDMHSSPLLEKVDVDLTALR